MQFFNELLIKKVFSGFIYKMFIRLGNEVTSKLLDNLKDLGFKYATKT